MFPSLKLRPSLVGGGGGVSGFEVRVHVEPKSCSEHKISCRLSDQLIRVHNAKVMHAEPRQVEVH